LSIYLTAGAKLVTIAVNGQPIDVTQSTELGHPRLLMWVLPTPGEPLTITVDTDEPVVPGNPLVPVQPMAHTAVAVVHEAACGAPKS
jgi:hypothetical protein